MLTGPLGFGQNQLDKRITVDVEDVLLKDVFYDIITHHNVKISFQTSIIPDKVITLQRKLPLKLMLNTLLEGTDLSYNVVGEQIILIKRDQLPQAKRKFTISGFVHDANTGERLISASIFDRYNHRGTVTNEYGFFSLTLHEGPVELSVSYLGYKPHISKFNLDQSTSLRLDLQSNATLSEVIVVAKDTFISNLSGVTGSNGNIRVKDIEALPSLGGEPDLVRTMHFLPGIHTGTDGIGGIYVRGGNVGHNLVLIDDVPIYNISHAGGLFSIFNTSAIRSVDLIKGGVPARFGGRLSSVLDIRTKDGNNKQYGGRLDVGLLSGRISLEGPIQKDKSSFFVSARQSLLNWYLGPLSRATKSDLGEDGETSYEFQDINAKFNFQLGDTDNLYLSFYKGQDNFQNQSGKHKTFSLYDNAQDVLNIWNYNKFGSEDWQWGNTVAALRWNHLFNDKLFANTTLTYSKLAFSNHYINADSLINGGDFSQQTIFRQEGKFETGIEDIGIKIDFQYLPNPNQSVRFGFSGVHHQFTPGIRTSTDAEGIQGQYANRTIHSLEFGAYLEDQIQLSKELIINLGVHVSAMTVDNTLYSSVQPRLFANYSPSYEFDIWASYSRMTQYLHLLTQSNLGLPSDIWVPATDVVPPENAWQTTLGVGFNLNKDWSFSLEGYYKRMNDLINFTEGAFTLTNWESNITQGNGQAYGVEMMLRKTRGQTTGWLSYTLAWTDRQFEHINFGRRYPFKYDRRHQVGLTFVHKAKSWLDITGSWTLSSGFAFNIPYEEIVYVSPDDPLDVSVFLNYGDKNEFRMPIYHRLDVGANFKFYSGQFSHLLNIGVYNLYDRRNPLYYNLRRDFSNNDNYELVERKEFVEVWLLPFLPSMSYTIKF